ncbi:hypothetical protein [Streptomyces levis]|uniref:hypothetical protein n=1 Tax=Streptomyces levis TaxID=285566 RepID=UPI003C7A08DE
MEIKNAFSRLRALRQRHLVEAEGGSDVTQAGGVDQRCRPKRSLKLKIGTVVVAATLTLGLVRAVGGALFTIEDFYDRGGVCGFDVLRQIDSVDENCSTAERSDETSV